MFKRILLPTSGSPIAAKKARTICQLLNDYQDAEVTILYVMKSYPNYAVVNSQLAKEDIDPNQIYLDDAKKIVRKALQVFKEQNVPYKIRIEVGEPVETIVKVAEEIDAQLMVIGYHGESKLSDYLFKGNITSRLIDNSKCPLLVVK
ncbi:MAG: universal stress protein [Clostridia bacterium]|nr:universal stress protein [Clostridia bacterium]